MKIKGTLPRIISTISSIIIISSVLAGCGGGTTGGSSGGGGGGGTSATLDSISVTPAAPTIGLGGAQLFAATGTYSDSSTKDLTSSVSWSSSDTNVASISNTSGSKGLATSVAAGPATITATLGSISGSATMTVTQTATSSVSLPRTGQTILYAKGDDGDLEKGVDWPSTRFTESGDCVTDTLTGLMWVKTPGAATMTWEGALSYTDGLNTCGFDDWRLPNVNELESLYHAGEPYSTDWLNTQGFSIVPSTAPEDSAWSSTTHASNPNYAWSVVMWNGDVDKLPKTTFPSSVWPVRTAQAGIIRLPKTGQTAIYGTGDDGVLQAGVSWPGARFTATDECVTDDLTGLMWVKAPDSTLRTWEGALTYANELDHCGYTDWRLPNRKELRSLINYGETNPVTWLNDQGFSNVQTISYWSSTTYAYDPANDVGLAWPAIMVDGSLVEAYKYNYDGAAWPVRDSQ